MTTPAEMESKVSRWLADVDRQEAVINGAANQEVTLRDGRKLKTLSKIQNDAITSVQQAIAQATAALPPGWVEALKNSGLTFNNKGDPGGNVMSIGLFVTAAALAIPLGTDMVATAGYTNPGQGSARYAVSAEVDAAYVAENPRSSFVSANGRGFKLAESIVDSDMFGAIGDNNTDDHGALQSWFDYGGSLHLNKRPYFSSQTLLVRRLVSMSGSGAGFDARKVTQAEMPGSLFRFPDNVAGILLLTQWNSETYVNTAVVPPEQEGAFGSILENFTILGGYTMPGPNHGLEARTRCFIRNVRAIGFGGVNIVYWGSSDLPDDRAPYGNVSCSGVHFCHASQGGMGGFKFAGRDCGPISVVGCDAILNNGWNYEDIALYPVTYVACHAASGGSLVDGVYQGGDYRSTSAIGSTTYVNCYIEGGFHARVDIIKGHPIIGGGLQYVPNINPFPTARDPLRAISPTLDTSSTVGVSPEGWALDVRAGCHYIVRLVGCSYHHDSASAARFGVKLTGGAAGTTRGRLFANVSRTASEEVSLSSVGVGGFTDEGAMLQATPQAGSPYYLPFGGEILFTCTTSGTLSVLIGTADAGASTIVPAPSILERIEI